jgi:hypothetical protein
MKGWPIFSGLIFSRLSNDKRSEDYGQTQEDRKKKGTGSPPPSKGEKKETTSPGADVARASGKTSESCGPLVMQCIAGPCRHAEKMESYRLRLQEFLFHRGDAEHVELYSRFLSAFSAPQR